MYKKYLIKFLFVSPSLKPYINFLHMTQVSEWNYEWYVYGLNITSWNIVCIGLWTSTTPPPPPLLCQALLFWQTPLYKLRSCQAPPFWKFSRRFKGEGEGCALCQIRWKDFLKDYNFGSSSFYIYFYGWTLIPSLEVLFRFSIVFPVNWVRIISKVQIFWDRKIK